MNIHTTAVWNIPYMAYGKGRGMKKKARAAGYSSVDNNMPNMILPNIEGPQYHCNIGFLILSYCNTLSSILYCQQYINLIWHIMYQNRLYNIINQAKSPPPTYLLLYLYQLLYRRRRRL